jgi:hypothetical protein
MEAFNLRDSVSLQARLAPAYKEDKGLAAAQLVETPAGILALHGRAKRHAHV